MIIKSQKNSSIETLNNHIEKAKEFLEVNELSLKNQKIEANDWYQILVADIEEIFFEDEAKEIVYEMNKILDEDIKELFTTNMMRTYGIVVNENIEAKVNLFQKKVKSIIQRLESLIKEIE